MCTLGVDRPTAADFGDLDWRHGGTTRQGKGDDGGGREGGRNDR